MDLVQDVAIHSQQTKNSISSSEPLSNLDSQFQVVKDPNARKSEEEKHEEQGFFDEPEIEEANLQSGSGPHTQAHHEGRLTKSEEIVTQQTTPLDNIELQLVQELPIHEEGFLDLDVEVPWPVRIPYNEEHRVIWQNEIQTTKNMFKVDGAEYAFSTWFTEAKVIDLASIILGAENEDEAMQEVYLQCLYQNYLEEEEINEIIKLAVDAYRASDKGSKAWLEHVEQEIESKKFEARMTEKWAQEILNAINNGEFLIRPIHESKKADRKIHRSGPNVILTKKTKPGFWVGIDEKFLVREVSEQSEHFDNTKRGHGLTEIHQQKINDWEKKMRIPGARVQDVAELEKILKRPIKLLDITHGTIFNSGKYRLGKYEEIGMVVHNGHAFPRNQHFPRDRMVEYYKGDTWEAISNALRGPQAIWLMGVGDTSQTISQFVLEDGRTFRTWKKHTEIIEACKQLVNDTIDWQYQEGIINKKKKSILSESLKVVDLAEQVFGTNHAGS
ncbi:4766_t:CDS:2 [Cetraspora pellucida]|uniref:4766_t:CDS:1 n=1 Tax=Cetraspora pellucida TaxID=1433469 RepID=A0ACA9MFT1_9GLOM|nr:4766_t:CDS:2 [Cetraspora pellucida]